MIAKSGFIGILSLGVVSSSGTTAMTQPKPWSESAVEIDGGRAPLRGTLLMPQGSSPLSAVLILPGSGPTDRDGNDPGLRNDCLKLLAQGLAESGIASLRIDKRGVGKSAAALGSERDLRFGSYVDDAVVWVRFLRQQERVRHLFLLGHSEGALVTTLAARRVQTDGLILVAGSGVPTGPLLRRQLDRAGLPGPLRDSAESILAELEKGVEVSDVPKELAPLFRPSVQPYVISWLKLDPADELAKVATPVLVIQGTTDIQVSVADANRLHDARPDADVVVLDGVNHVLREAPLDRDSNLATYGNPALPLAPGVVPTIAYFIQRHAR